MSERTRRIRSVTVLTSVAVLALSGCAASQQNAPADEDAARGTLRVALAAAPSSLDPANMEQSTSPFAQPAYDALINVATDGTLEPGLATEWGFIDDENKVFEITLRDGVTFSDGAELDAEGLVTHLEYLDTGKSNVVTLVNNGTYEARDEDTVRITWETPHPLAPQAFTQRWVAGMVISPDAIAADAAGLATQTAGAGAYTLDASATVAGSRYVYTARDDYWNPDAQHWDEIVITVMDNTEQRLNALKTGEVDYAAGDLGTADAAADAGLQVLSAPTVFYGLSLLDRDGTLGSPLADVRVRQAINYALDRETIATALLGDYGFATEQTVVPSEPGFVDELAGHYAYDPDKAKTLLADAGYADGFSIPVIASTSATAATLSQVLVDQLSKVGITVELDARPSADYFEAMTSGTFAAAVVGYGSQPIPMEYDGLFGPAAIFNPLASTSAAIEDDYQKAVVAPEAEATALYEAIQRELVEQAWFAPAVFAPVFYYASAELAPVEATEARPQAPLTELAPAE
ncbi:MULTISPECIES: ABC transporter substrate-binding protein [unclassified Microbacterium]|uniref:ABC transporter substrate-binding protein n=1 Tax=unclassified Microbacterium TaxID=2609290 RepID=UPI00214C9C1C|nr:MULTISPECIES: ABC transporter substrate-binding protein [unclassified Microbacterium]MCR2784334.1 ABC transporter substrate-binding protein [Microbacterium sp. zg.B96]WIM14840.1 ABC transporter substrate-binding protein [Microbacterium sp. zg-B96]